MGKSLTSRQGLWRQVPPTWAASPDVDRSSLMTLPVDVLEEIRGRR